MEEKPTTRRRWYRFNLRTLFLLVTFICIYLGWAMNWIRQRHEFLQRTDIERGVRVATHSGEVLTTAPWQLKLLGEKGVGFMRIPRTIPHIADEAKRLFPEANVYFVYQQPYPLNWPTSAE